jgi:DNA-directed RNA polymerase subunit RPC12/RpoP
MPNSTYFVQDCPTCGRRLQIRVEYLGRKLACDHCRGRFIARDPSSLPAGRKEADLLGRAEALLRSLDKKSTPHRPPLVH